MYGEQAVFDANRCFFASRRLRALRCMGHIRRMETGEKLERVLDALRGAGEETRLRILHALSRDELAVSELTQVLAQSQPRISRHLKLMTEAGLIERRREGSWAFFRLTRHGFPARLANFALDALEIGDSVLDRDRHRLEHVRAKRADLAEAYFEENAGHWDKLRSMHAPEAAVEAAARTMFVPQSGKFSRLIDLGAGTGRMLELFADRFESGVGYDVNQPMLALARSRLATAGLNHAELRQEDILALPDDAESADGAILHQVLHFLLEPSLAIAEASRVLSPNSPLLVVDFAPHDAEALRDSHAHRRLGFARAEIEEMGAAVGLSPVGYEEIPAEQTSGSDALTVSLWLMKKTG